MNQKLWKPGFLSSSLLLALFLQDAPETPDLIRAPVSTSVTSTPGNGTDLTNQDSLVAATFRNGGSFTTLSREQQPIGLEKVAGGFSSPMMIALPPDGPERMAVVDQIGVVKMIGTGQDGL